MQLQLPRGRTLEAFGDSTNKVDGQKLAHVYALMNLQKSGELQGLLNEISVENVYDYAAAYYLLPEVIFETGKQATPAARCSVTIRLQEHGIEVTEQGETFLEAQISAVASFLGEAERHVQHEAEEAPSAIHGFATRHAESFIQSFLTARGEEHIEALVEEIPTDAAGDAPSVLFKCTTSMHGRSTGRPITALNKEMGVKFANLAAAIEILKADPGLCGNWRELTGHRELCLLKLSMPPAIVPTLNGIIDDAELLGLPAHYGHSLGNDSRFLDTHQRTAPQREEVVNRSKMLLLRHDQTSRRPAGVKMRRFRDSLPMNEFRHTVLDTIENNPISIIVGATGSGKTSQVPQIILEDYIESGIGAECNIVCTQPRRIAATSVALRVATERLEQLGDTVGYKVRFDANPPRYGGSITYCTTGVFLNQILHSTDATFETTSHIIIDEVHERSLDIDFILNILRRTTALRRSSGKKTPKIILMSATLDSELLKTYFQQETTEGQSIVVPTLQIPGRTFPVENKYLHDILNDIEHAHGRSAIEALENDGPTKRYINAEKDLSSSSDETWETGRDVITAAADDSANQEVESEDAVVPIRLVGTTIAHIIRTTSDGALLVFLPGLEEMRKVKEFLEVNDASNVDFADTSVCRILILHSTVPASEQADAFQPVTEGCRKIILATNIAESSVTIPDVKFVIDTGRAREKRYDPMERTSMLQCNWISKSNAKQRAGRAGRVQNGHYYALYSEGRLESFNTVTSPQILHSDLRRTCLDVSTSKLPCEVTEFFQDFIKPPPLRTVEAALDSLATLQALDKERRVTYIGQVLAALPVDPSMARLIFMGIAFRCVDPVILLAAAFDEAPLFLAPEGLRAKIKEDRQPFFEDSGSDHIGLINVFRSIRTIRDNEGVQAAHEFCAKNHIHWGAVEMALEGSEQIEGILVSAGVIPNITNHERYASERGHPSLNINSTNINVLRALILFGLQPNLGWLSKNGTFIKTVNKTEAIPHPGSVNHIRNPRRLRERSKDSVFAYSAMRRSNDGQSVFLSDTSVCSPLSTLLFGGKKQYGVLSPDTITVHDSIHLKVQSPDPGALQAIARFEKAFDRIVAHAFDLVWKLSESRRLSRARDDEDISSEVSATESRRYLADDPILDAFATGVVDLLDLDSHLEGESRKSTESQHQAPDLEVPSKISTPLNFGDDNAREAEHSSHQNPMTTSNEKLYLQFREK